MAQRDTGRVELVWPGKFAEDGALREPPRVSLPFQVIERIHESRASREARRGGLQSGLFETWQGREGDTFEQGWKNKLIWGDNLLVMSSLLENFAGKIDLIYIDPPFATGADFSFTAQIGESGDKIAKKASVIEEKAYRDTWSQGIDSYLSMMFARLSLVRELLSENGSIYLHCGVQVNHYLRMVMQDVFGEENEIEEIIWNYGTASGGRAAANKIIKTHEYIIAYAKRYGEHLYNKAFIPYSEKYIKERFTHLDEDNRRYRTRRRSNGSVERQYLDESSGVPLSSVWTDIKQTYALHLVKRFKEETGYATQKPEALLRRIIEISSDEGALVADFFCGSGTTAAVAEKLGRRWIACDLGRYAVHTTRKRMLSIEDCRPFEVLNLGKYERQYWQGVTFGESRGKPPTEQAIYDYLAFILKLYGAEPISGSAHLHGKKGRALVHIGAVDAPVTIEQAGDALKECLRLQQTELHILGWEWEMGMNDLMADMARQQGVRLLLLQIPREVMEQQAVDRDDVHFFELAYLEAEIERPGERGAQVSLREFVIPNTELIPAEIRGKISQWSDYIDYWAVDWDFRNDTFMQGWVAYRTRTERKLPLQSEAHSYEQPGNYRILVKVIDIFGNDTTRAFDVEVA